MSTDYPPNGPSGPPPTPWFQPPQQPPPTPPWQPPQPFPQPGVPSNRRGRVWLIAGCGVFLAIIAVILIITVGGGSSFTAHGTAQDCTGVISDGTQAVVTDSSGKVIGTGTLVTDNSKAALAVEQQYDQLQLGLGSLGGNTSGMSIYDFTASGLPSGLSRYGINLGSGHGTVWFSEKEMVAGPGRSLSC